MNVTECLCCVALRQVMGDGGDGLVRLIGGYFGDRSQALTTALTRANDRAWRALEIALAGESLWGVFDSGSDKALRAQLKQFIDRVPLPDFKVKDHQRLRLLALAELRDARKQELLSGRLEPEKLAKEAGALARHGDPQALIDGEKRMLGQMADALKRAGYDNLAWLLAQPAHADESLLVVSAKFFFRREIERDERLANTLHLSILDGLVASQQDAFRDLDQALAEHGTRLEQGLMHLQTQVLTAVGRVGMQVAEQGQHLAEIKELQEQVLELVRRLDMQSRPVEPSHSLSLHSDRERQMVKEMLKRFRSLSPREQETHPDLINDLGKLQVAAGDFRGARESFDRVAALATTDRDRAEAHHNAYRAALEAGDCDAALRELLQALAIDPARFAPFPVDKYEPIRVLGAGGFGVTFLCQHRLSKGQVAVKALFAGELDRDAATVLQEASALDSLRHRSIVGLRDCGYVDAEQRRPYLVMEYFAGDTLEEHVKRNGPLSFEAVKALAVSMAEALQAAHSKNILHRDVKPANVLIRPLGDRWEVRLIDFGLALKAERLENATSTLRRGQTLIGSAIAGTLGYAAPEQLGRLPGVRVGPPADVYGYGKTLAYALFGVTEPTLQHYRKLPEDFAELLSQCMAQEPRERPATFTEVLRGLLRRPKAQPRPVEMEAIPVPVPVSVSVPVPATVPSARVVQVAEELVPIPVEPLRRQPERARPYEDDRPRYRDAYDPGPRRPFQVETTFATRLVAALLAVFLGFIGAHKFAQGNAAAGIVRVVLSATMCMLPVVVLFGVAEGLIYLARTNEDYHRRYLRDWQMWF